ncbi:AMP-binding protein [Streptococcus sp. SGI.013]|uniref:AMP-binding protein n=1 Tax=unclassified Streptococcus TaxID=2608887 RepID=UPI003D078CA2
MSIFQQLLNRKNSTNYSVLTTKEKISMNNFLSLVGEIQQILENNGIQSGDKVVLVMTPSKDTVATIMAIGFIGATYVPVDFSIPKNRISYIIKDTNAKAVITNQKYLLLQYSSEVKKLFIKDIKYCDTSSPILRKRAEDSIAYILYTSGSTGNPKGVEVSFSNLEFFIKNFNSTFTSSENSVFVLNTALQFDVSIAELYGWISRDSSLLILDSKEIKDVKKLPLIIREHKITHLSIAPSILNTYGDNEINILKTSNLEYLLVAGEDFPISLAKKLRDLVMQSKVYNCYGPTEATVYATYYKLSIDDLDNEKIPIGKPFANISTLLVPEIDTPYFELYLTGDGIAKGYVNLKKKTSEVFPNIGGRRYYRTGDLVLLDEDTGNLIFAGRKDFQLEINSIRVEPGEIENAVTSVLNTDHCIVLKLNKKLVCFYLKTENTKNIDYTKKALFEILPSYMIPSFWEPLETFPLNINGKIDRKKLIEDYSEQNTIKDEGKNKLLDDIRYLTGISNLGFYDNLFDSGVDSLSVVELEIYLESEFSISLPPGYIYLHPTVYDIQNDLGHNNGIVIDKNQSIESILEDKRLVFKLVREKNDHYKLKISEGELSTLKSIDTQSEKFSHIQSAVFEENEISIFNRENNSFSIVNLYDKDTQNSYESTIFQKVYFDIKLNSFIEADFEYSDNICADTTKNLIKYLVNKVEVFRTTINRNSDNILYSNVHKNSDISINVKDLTTLNQVQRENLIEEDKIDAKKLIMENLFGSPLYRILAYRVSFNKIKLNIILHHSIADGASVTILSKYVSNYFQKKDASSLGTKLYLEKLSKNSNAIQLLENSYIKKLKSINKYLPNNPPKSSIWEKGFKIVKNVGEMDKWQKFLAVADEVTDEYLQKYELIEITFQMLFDFRTIGEDDFELLVNDCHETVTFYRHKNTNTVEFINDFYNHIRNFHYQNGISLGYAIYNNFPLFNNEQQKLKEIVEVSPININYIGEVSEKNVNKKINEIEQLKDQLKNLKNQTRFTAFSSGDDIYIFQVSNL